MTLAIQPLCNGDDLRALLTRCGLPVADVTLSTPPLDGAGTGLPNGSAAPRPQQFFGCCPTEGGGQTPSACVAAVGLEWQGPVGLLRSLAVAPEWRGQGLAQALLRHAETVAAAQGVGTLYLLTTTAEAFFRARGYRPADRALAPAFIRAAPQFSGLCPASAAFLCKP